MRFKPVTPKYVFDGSDLIREFPAHLQTPISTWIRSVLENVGMSSWGNVDEDFLNNLDLLLREPEPFPRDHRYFFSFVMADPDRTINVIALCLQNYANPYEANQMEYILSTGGSAYAVMLNAGELHSYDRGIADIVERVPEAVREGSKEVLDANSLIREAWHSCYSRNPDYAKTVSKCVDALEGVFKSKYFPKDSTPTLGKFLNDFAKNPAKLSFQGDTLLKPKSMLTELAQQFTPIRGHHTSGTGRTPTKEEAVFVLHYAIFILQVHT